MPKKIREPSEANANHAFWRLYQICPACRNYNLERSFCDYCNKQGIIQRHNHDFTHL